jgi:hypothetical protein
MWGKRNAYKQTAKTAELQASLFTCKPLVMLPARMLTVVRGLGFTAVGSCFNVSSLLRNEMFKIEALLRQEARRRPHAQHQLAISVKLRHVIGQVMAHLVPESVPNRSCEQISHAHRVS